MNNSYSDDREGRDIINIMDKKPNSFKKRGDYMRDGMERGSTDEEEWVTGRENMGTQGSWYTKRETKAKRKKQRTGWWRVD